MSEFIYGKSISGLCGDFVIVRKETMDSLEAQARLARDVVARASTATTVGEMGDHFAQLPYAFSFDWESAAYEDILTDVLGEDPDQTTLRDITLTPELWDEFLERMFTDPYSGCRMGQTVFDVTACYDAVVDVRSVAPFVRYAQHDPAAGFNDIDGAVRALEAEGHSCCRDDDRINDVFGFVVTERFIVP